MTDGNADTATERLVDAFDRQSRSAVQRSSPLYTALLDSCVRDLAEGGPTWALLADRADEPTGHALPLRLLAGVHWLVLSGQAPLLAPYYPSVGGVEPPGLAWPVFQHLLAERADDLRVLLDRPLQTNEVRRCSALLVGLNWIATATKRPCRVLEIGASAGLNLNWHRYRYQGPDGGWGPLEAPVRLVLPAGMGRLAPELAASSVGVGCDRAPLDVASGADQQWLRSCIWADQVDRLADLDAALALAVVHPTRVERGEATGWLARQLRDVGGGRGTATVVVQTFVQQYLSGPQRADLAEVIDRAAAGATHEAPLAWLQLEPPDDPDRQPRERQGMADIRVRLWPGQVDQVLGYAGYHGSPVVLST